jgi:hypothetical protein
MLTRSARSAGCADGRGAICLGSAVLYSATRLAHRLSPYVESARRRQVARGEGTGYTGR